MCLICIDFLKEKITKEEAKKNLNEIVIGKEINEEYQKHIEEVLNLINQPKQQ